MSTTTLTSTIKAFIAPEVDAIIDERIYSMSQWAVDDFDDCNTLNDWVTYICMYATESAKIVRKDDAGEIYSKLIKVANLALLAAERVRSETIAPRHYDTGRVHPSEIKGNLSD